MRHSQLKRFEDVPRVERTHLVELPTAATKHGWQRHLKYFWAQGGAKCRCNGKNGAAEPSASHEKRVAAVLRVNKFPVLK
jgi:hypothetical protein